jgi:hypothetical protein
MFRYRPLGALRLLRALCGIKNAFYFNWVFTTKTTIWNRKMRESNHTKPIQPQDPAPSNPNFIFSTYHSQIKKYHS